MPRIGDPTPVQSLAQFESVTDALLDKVTLTFHLRIPAQGPGGSAMLRARLAAAKIVGPGRGGPAEVSFRWRCPLSGETVWMGGAMTLSDAADGSAVIGGGSRIELSLLRLLREQVSPVCEPGLDGALNVVGPPEEDRGRLLGLQLATVAGMLDGFLTACAAAIGSPVSPRMWVRAAEVNRDLPRAGAPSIVHRLVGEPNPWHRLGWARHYAGPADPAHDGNYATVTWPNDRKDAPIRLKFYAKAADLLRVEVCFDNREAVLLGASQAGMPWPEGPAADGVGVAARLGILARAALPLLDAMSAHAARLDAPQREVLELVVALAPLMRAGAPPPARRPGARAGGQTRADVREALYHLLVLGRFDASGLRANGTVRKALRLIAAEGGLLHEPRGRAALFTVDPSFAGARAAMRMALWPEREVTAPGPRRLGRSPVE